MADNVAMRNAHRAACAVGRKAAESVGVRSTKTSVVTTTYDLPVGSPGAVVVSTSTLVLTPRPKVTDGATTPSSFGSWYGARGSLRLQAGQYMIGPITLPYPGGGYSLDQLIPAGSDKIVSYYLLEGSGFKSGGERFDLVEWEATRAHQANLIVQRTSQE